MLLSLVALSLCPIFLIFVGVTGVIGVDQIPMGPAVAALVFALARFLGFDLLSLDCRDFLL